MEAGVMTFVAHCTTLLKARLVDILKYIYSGVVLLAKGFVPNESIEAYQLRASHVMF